MDSTSAADKGEGGRSPKTIQAMKAAVALESIMREEGGNRPRVAFDTLNSREMTFVNAIADLIVDQRLFRSRPAPSPPAAQAPPASRSSEPKATPAPVQPQYEKFVPLEFTHDGVPPAGVKADEELFVEKPFPSKSVPQSGAPPPSASPKPMTPVPAASSPPPRPQTPPASPSPAPNTPSSTASPPPMPPPAPPPAPTNFSVQLKPGTVGSAYAAPLPKIEAQGVRDFSCAGLRKLGLSIDEATGEVKGEPTTAGEYKLDILAKMGAAGAAKAIIITAELLINPNPRSLWKTLEPPADAPFKKDHEVAISIADGDFMLVGASKRGRSHAHEAKFREDAIGAEHLKKSGWHIAVVADGAGSAALSRLGSEVAIKTSLKHIRETLEAAEDKKVLDMLRRFGADPQGEAAREVGTFLYNTLVTAAHTAAKALEKEAAEKSIPLRDVSTTLILNIVRKVPDTTTLLGKKADGGVFVGSFSIGDGGAALLGDKPGHLKTLTLPDSGEFAGQTRFLSLNEFGQDVTSRLKADFQRSFEAIMLMTDGVTDPFLPTETNFADPEKWWTLYKDITDRVSFKDGVKQAETQLLTWLDFWSQGNHDDRTIIVIRPKG